MGRTGGRDVNHWSTTAVQQHVLGGKLSPQEGMSYSCCKKLPTADGHGLINKLHCGEGDPIPVILEVASTANITGIHKQLAVGGGKPLGLV